ncbi:MAG TPA: hypothetical protein VFH61_15715 [Thermoleophilia bacterium]|nr:hypothetical protein [Thermoleophilia bacterium]
MSKSQQLKGVCRGGSVPIVFSYRRVTKRPEVKRHRRFVGFKNVMRNISIKAIELIEDLAYETETEVLDAGEQQVVHWQLQVDDPWRMGRQAGLIVSRVEDRPACGANFEIVTIEDPADNVIDPDAQAARPQNHDQARARMRDMLKKEGHFDQEAGFPADDDADAA